MSKNKKRCALCGEDITHKDFVYIPQEGRAVRICKLCDKARFNEKLSNMRGVNRMRVDMSVRN